VFGRSGEGVGVWGGLGGHGGGGAKEVRASIETLGFYERERTVSEAVDEGFKLYEPRQEAVGVS
jgi:hypothetical protein